MDRFYQANVSDTPPVPPSPGVYGFVQSDVPYPLAETYFPTTPGPWDYHFVTESIRNVIVAAGLEPDPLNLHQLADAIELLLLDRVAYPLDPLSILPAMAYSTRRLLAAYSGPSMRVRRDSDNAEQDINFVDGQLDTDGLMAFVGGGSGFVSIWYDQSGYGFDASQPSHGSQPVIVQGGVLIEIYGFPSVFFNANNLTFDNREGAQDDFTLSAVFSTTQSNTVSNPEFGYEMGGFIYSDLSGNAYDLGFGNLGNKLTLWGGGAGGEQGVLGETTINDGGLHVGLVSRVSANGAIDLSLDGNPDGSGIGAIGTRSQAPDCQLGSAGINSGSSDGSSRPAVVYMPEAVIYASVLSDDDYSLLQDAQRLYIRGAV